MPLFGISLIPRPAKYSGVSPRGAGPEEFSPVSFPVFASQTIANRSPPIPSIIGSVTANTAFAAIAASTADPPRARIRTPSSEASAWQVATIPCRVIVMDRP